jgi:prolyl oligopeptidase
MQRPTLRLLILALFTSLFANAQSRLPNTPRHDVIDNYFGTQVVDPYRWLEKTSDPEVIAWMKAQNDYTREILARIPQRDKLVERVKSLDNAGSVVYGLQVWGGHYFYLKAETGSDNRRLYVRDAVDAAERLLLDPERLTTADGRHFSIDYFQPSLDGKYVAYGISPGGSEDSVMHLLETATGAALPDVIDRAQFGQPSWLPDGKSFFYPRLQRLSQGAPPTAKYQKIRVYLHRLGSDPERDQQIFGYGMGLKVLEDDFSAVAYSPAAPNAVIGVVIHGVKNEKDFYVAPFQYSPMTANAWKKVADDSADITAFDVHGDDLFLLSHKDASRYKVLRTSLSRPDLTKATLVVPPSDVVITNITAGADGLYIQDLDGGVGRLRRLAYRNGKAAAVKLPFDGAIQTLFTNPTEAGAWLELTSWTRSSVWYLLRANGTAEDTHIVAPSSVDFSNIESQEVKVRSTEGTMVPLSIIHQRGITNDGSHPTWLEGYGSYGITLDPTFRPTWLAFLEKGGIFAVAHVRGGGEYGEDWHNGGRLLTKQHTIDDFLACAQYLIDNKYTSRAKLAGEGTSAGGITIGGAISQRPDLFTAALIRVGDSDSLRSELMESGPANIPEFGTVKEPDGFKALYAMDAYQHVKPDTAYPAVLLTTGVNDPRVAPWQAAKMAARLQASTNSGRPVLLRVDYDAGHGLGSTKSQRDAEFADELAFLFWQFGIPEYQPK